MQFCSHWEDMDWSVLKDLLPNAEKVFCLVPNNEPTPLIPSNLQQIFRKKLLEDTLMRWQDKLGPVETIEKLEALKSETFDFIFTRLYHSWPYTRPYTKLRLENTKLIKIARDYDRKAWPYATHGFFRFKEQIGNFLTALN